MRKILAIVIGVATAILTPFAGCYDDHAPTFTDVDMRIAVEGTWKLTRPGGTQITFTVRESAKPLHARSGGGLVRSAAACSDRSFVRAAAACEDSTSMPLEIALASGEKLDGLFMAFGFEFRGGRLQIGGERGFALSADIDATGRVTHSSIGTLVRIAH